jgi:hypothetical protein
VTRRLGWLLVPVLAVLVWWLARGGDPTTQTTQASSAPPVAARSEAAGTASGTTAPAPRDPTPSDRASAPVPPGGSRTADATARLGDPAARPARAAAPAPGLPVAPPPAPPSAAAATGSADAPSGGLTDKTGWADNSAIKKVNKELMPLINECIEQAKARNPRLAGLLALAMNVAPTENHKIIVSVTPSRDNQIEDPELLECIRESSFSIDGLKAPHDFSMTIRVDPTGETPAPPAKR